MAVSNAIVRTYRDFAGKGPSSCKAYWAGQDVLLVMMQGGFSAAERLLYESGHGDVVRESWHRLQDTLEEQITSTIGELTGRKVTAFMSATHQDPDLMAQLFVLEPDGGEDPRASADERASRR